MTATTSASRVITAHTCPHWCDGHDPADNFHVHDLPRTWGDPDDGPVLSLALQREDTADGPGLPRIDVQVSVDGILIDLSLRLGIAEARDYARTMADMADAAEQRSIQTQRICDLNDQPPSLTAFHRVTPCGVKALAE